MAGATITFIQIIDKIFDILNSVNLFAKVFKSPITKYNEMVVRKTIQGINYFRHLKLDRLTYIMESKRKPIIGFI